VTSLAEAAAIFADTASVIEAEAALQVVTEQAEVYLPILQSVTPMLSGRLRLSETLNALTGGGTFAAANLGPHTVYAEFRNDGGTITAKRFPQLGNPEAGWFGKSVTQTGSHYMERAQAEAAGECEAAAEQVVDVLTAPLNL
jgi:hypothetical protein